MNLRELSTFLLMIQTCQSDQYKVTDQVYFDLECEGVYLGQVVIGLFGEIVPKTVANFKVIATNGINETLTYEGTKLHRVVERFLIQGGDIIHNNGSGSISIYGPFFKDENFKIKHNAPGIVSMANNGPNTNGCQFFITTMRTPWLDGSHVAFGRVVKGQEIVHKIEHMKTDTDYRPLKDNVIIRSGLIRTKTPFYETDEPYEYSAVLPFIVSTIRPLLNTSITAYGKTGLNTWNNQSHKLALDLKTDYRLTLWAWIKAGWFPLSFSFAILGFFQWLMMQLKV